tara:strand:+ start:613 stop:1386 length:774 start_codon:yes stop_codon:yes gene_type:complete
MEAGLELFVQITDPGGEESLLDAVSDKGLDINKLHWNYTPPAIPEWDTLIHMADMVKMMGYKDLGEIKQGINKDKYQQYWAVLQNFKNFHCQRTGEDFGPVDFFTPDRALAVDTLTGINQMALDMVVGAKPTAHVGEYGVGMKAEEMLLMKLTGACKCFLVVNGHTDRGVDEVEQKTKTRIEALGNKLAPKIPRTFSDVVLAYREGSQFFWSTTATNVDLKRRALPLAEKITPDYGQIVEAWKKRVKTAQATASKKA